MKYRYNNSYEAVTLDEHEPQQDVLWYGFYVIFPILC